MSELWELFGGRSCGNCLGGGAVGAVSGWWSCGSCGSCLDGGAVGTVPRCRSCGSCLGVGAVGAVWVSE